MDIIEIDRGDEPIVKAAQKRKRSVTINNDQTDPDRDDGDDDEIGSSDDETSHMERRMAELEVNDLLEPESPR